MAFITDDDDNDGTCCATCVDAVDIVVDANAEYCRTRPFSVVALAAGCCSDALCLATTANAIGAGVGIIVDDVDDDVVSVDVSCNDGVVAGAAKDELVVAFVDVDIAIVMSVADAA